MYAVAANGDGGNEWGFGDVDAMLRGVVEGGHFQHELGPKQFAIH